MNSGNNSYSYAFEHVLKFMTVHKLSLIEYSEIVHSSSNSYVHDSLSR